MSLLRSNRLELCRVRLAYLLTDGRLALTEPQTLLRGWELPVSVAFPQISRLCL
jgi:hypothetical protein